MRTKIYLLLIALVATVGSVWGQTPDFEVDGVWYRELTSSTVAVVEPNTVLYDSYSGDVVIPATVTSEGGTTYNVTEIATSAFRYCYDLTSITLGNNLTTIRSQAFYYCTSLTTITIPASVTFVDPGFIGYCTSLEEIVVAAGNTVYRNDNDGVLYTIANVLIKYPSGKEGPFTIPAFVTALGRYSFAEASLQTITVPNTVTSVQVGAFSNAPSLQSIIVESGHPSYSSLDGVLFNNTFTSLIQYPAGKVMPNGVYHAPSTVTTLVQGSFAEVPSLREVHLPNTITDIPPLTFRLCESLETVTGIENVLTIGQQAFDGCTSLKNFELPENLTTIGVGAFLKCTNLFSGNLEIPQSVTTIGRLAFSGCSSLESFSVESGNTLFTTDESGVLFSTTAPKTLMQYPLGSKQKSYSMPDDIEEIAYGAFLGVEFEKLTLSEGLTAIASNAFEDSNIGVLVFSSDTPPALHERTFAGVSEDMVVATSSKDPAVIAGYEAIFVDKGAFLSEFVVTLDYNDGVTPNSFLGIDPATSKLRVELEIPSRSGYDFVGWYDEDDDKWVAGTIVSSDMVLTAHWTLTPAPVTPPVKATYTVTINPLAGVDVNKSSTTVSEGNSFNFTAEATTSGYSVIVSVNGTTLSAVSGITYLIGDIRENKTVTFRLVAGSITPTPPTPPGDGTTPPPPVVDPVIPGPGTPGGPGQIIIDENSPSELPGEFPGDGQIIIRPPLVDPNDPTPPKVIIDGKEVEGEWKTDEDGNPVFVIDLDGLEDGKHTIIINDKEFEFTVDKNARPTSNDVLSTATVTAGYGTVTIDTPKSATVYIVSFSGSVVYNAKVIGTATVNVPAGIYVVVVDGSVTKVVVR